MRDALRRVFLLPAAVIVLGCVPGLAQFLYSGHGGIFWLVLPLCFPYILVRVFLEVRKLSVGERVAGSRMFLCGILIYVVLAYPATRWTEHYVTSAIGLPIRSGLIFKLATFPVGFLLPPYS